MHMECECRKCGNTLEAEASVDRSGTIQLDIQPCEICIEKAKAEGSNEGHMDGYDVGLTDGKSEGYDDGYEKGLEDGQAEPGGNGP